MHTRTLTHTCTPSTKSPSFQWARGCLDLTPTLTCRLLAVMLRTLTGGCWPSVLGFGLVMAISLPTPNSHIPLCCQAQAQRAWLAGAQLPVSWLYQGWDCVQPMLDGPGAGCWAGHSQHGGRMRVAACSQVLVNHQRDNMPGQDCFEGTLSRLEQGFLGKLHGGLWLAWHSLQAKGTWQRDQSTPTKPCAGGVRGTGKEAA